MLKRKIEVLVFSVLLSVVTMGCSNEGTRAIKVYGSGEVSYVPDTVTMTVTIKDIKPVMKDAITNTNTTCKALLSLFKKYSINDEDIKTSYAQTDREYEWENSKNVFKGFSSKQTIQVTYKDLSKIEEFTGDILALQVYSLGNFKYNHSNKSDYDSKANLLALDNAKNAAEKMAERMNVKLGKVLYISDVGPDDSFYYGTGYEGMFETASMNKSLDSSSGFVVAPGILASKKKVIVSFEIK